MSISFGCMMVREWGIKNEEFDKKRMANSIK